MRRYRPSFISRLLALKLALGIFLLGALIGHAWVANIFSEKSAAYRQKADDLRTQILAPYHVSRWEDQADSIIGKSPYQKALKSLEEQERRADTTVSYLMAAALVWPGLSIVILVAFFVRYWRAKDKSDLERAARRQRVWVIATFFAAVSLAVAAISWRNIPIYKAITAWASLAVLVSILGVVLLELFWHLLASGRLRSRLISLPASTKRVPQALAVAATSLLAAADLEKLLEHISPSYFQYYFVRQATMAAQVTIWLAIIFGLGSVALDYLKLPTKDATSSSAPVPAPPLTAAAVDRIASRGQAQDTLDEDLALRQEITRLAHLIQAQTGQSKPRIEPIPDAAIARTAQIRDRLVAEIGSLTRRGNLSLIIGISTSLLAAATLLMLIAKAPEKINSETFLAYYAPRVSVAIFIEVFSFFFLRLYRAVLSDMVYYQNELTNLESRFLAIDLAFLAHLGGEMPSLIRDLSTTDRNAATKKGESVAEIEKVKAEQQSLRSLVEGALKIVPELVKAKG